MLGIAQSLFLRVPIVDDVFCIVVCVSVTIDHVWSKGLHRVVSDTDADITYILTIYKFSLLSDHQGQSML